jgi:hypothetical protein
MQIEAQWYERTGPRQHPRCRNSRGAAARNNVSTSSIAAELEI